MNESLRELQVILAKRVQKLSDKLGEAPNAAAAQALLNEMQEFNHRVIMTGQLLFRDQANELDEKVAEIKRSTRKVDKAVREIDQLADSLAVITDFLSLVDEAIDLAKSIPIV